MIISINLDELDSKIVKFYEDSNNMMLIKDALIHGFNIVKSGAYALNLKNTSESTAQTISDLSTENESLKSELADLKVSTQIEIDKNTQKLSVYHMNQKQEIEENYQKKFKNQCEIIENDYKSLLESKNAEILQFKQQISENFMKLSQIRDEERNFYDPKLVELQKKNEELNFKLNERNLIYQNSSKKGKEGENDILVTLNSLFPNATIEDTHTQARSGDIRIEYSGVQILFENKNFSSNVPKRDIEKFRRDVQESDAHCGIMCSENTGIANKNDLDIEIFDNKPLIYLHNTKNDIDKVYIAILILANIIEKNMQIDLGDIQNIKELIKETENIQRIYNIQKRNLNNSLEMNEKLKVSNNTIKFKLESILKNDKQSTKSKCPHCSKVFVDLEKHIQKKHPDVITNIV